MGANLKVILLNSRWRCKHSIFRFTCEESVSVYGSIILTDGAVQLNAIPPT